MTLTSTADSADIILHRIDLRNPIAPHAGTVIAPADIARVNLFLAVPNSVAPLFYAFVGIYQVHTFLRAARSARTLVEIDLAMRVSVPAAVSCGAVANSVPSQVDARSTIQTFKICALIDVCFTMCALEPRSTCACVFVKRHVRRCT